MISITQRTIIDEQTELLLQLQRQLRYYQAQLILIKAEAEAELARIEDQGGCAGFAQRILALAGERP